MKMMTSELDRTRAIRVGQVTEKMNIYRSNIHLLNLQTLFEFCLPAIQDYGSLLKNNDFLSFNIAFHNLLLLFILCRNKGSHDYQRTMFVFALLLRYWEENGLPIMDLLRANHTLFSEESGEIALSVLARGTPPSSRVDLQQVQHHWQMVRLKQDSPHPEKKHRLIRTFSLFPFFACKSILWPFYRRCCFVGPDDAAADLVKLSLPSELGPGSIR